MKHASTKIKVQVLYESACYLTSSWSWATITSADKKAPVRSLETTNFHVAVTLKEDRCTRFHSFFCSVQRNWHVHCLLRRLSTGISLHAATIEGATILYQSMLHSTRSYNKNYCFLSSRGILPQLLKSHATINIYAQCTWAQHLVITPGSPTSILERLHCD